MENSDGMLIVIDAGHGGWDNGATWNGRREKDDNLRLALEVEKQLGRRGIPVIMTRNSDVYVSLADRAKIANEANASLFVSLHRNSYIEPTPQTNGVENFIYLTAPEETTGKAAMCVLNQVVNAGVQSNRGVSRGDYYVLRRTMMPAMLLEMGFIINETDNRLFDEHLDEYAAAIANGIMQYMNAECQEEPGTPPMECPACPNPGIQEAQRLVNEWFGLDMPLSGIFDNNTKKTMTIALQMALNSDLNAGLTVDGILGPKTLRAIPNIFYGNRGNVIFIMQALLQLNGYAPGELDGAFGPLTRGAVQAFQRDHFLTPDSVIGPSMVQALFDGIS